jgi:chemotaxis protein MotB
MAALAALRAKRPRIVAVDGGGTESWLTTYTDMVTLLLTLFVFLVAISNLQKDKTPAPAADAAAAEPAREAPDLPDARQPAAPPAPGSSHQGSSPDLVPAEQVPPDFFWLRDRAAELEAFAIDHDLAQAMTVERTDRSLVVHLRDGILFDSARADLTGEGEAVVRRLAPLLARAGGEIEVEGHTDSVPIRTPRYPSNWELSAARAAAVARKLIDNGVPAARLKAVGYADTRPVAGNGSVEDRAANRRVALLILARSAAQDR